VAGAGISRTGALVAGCFSVLVVAWCIATPVGGAPDEPAHVYRAASVLRGQVVPAARGPNGWVVRVPASYREWGAAIDCTKFRAEVPASCPLGASGPASTKSPNRLVAVDTGAGRYLPVYYAIVGLPSLVFEAPIGWYAMRLVSALIGAWLLTLAFGVAWRWRSSSLAAAMMIVLTPQALWLNGSVNPNAWEIDAGILLWISLLALVSGDCALPQRALVWRVALALIVELITRRLSPLWVVLTLGIVVLAFGARGFRARVGRAWPALAVLTAIGSVASVLWHVRFDMASLPQTTRPDAWGSLARHWEHSLVQTRVYVRQTYGWFGWLDVRPPTWAALAWLVVVATLLSVVARHVDRGALAVAVGLGLCVSVPTILDASSWDLLGGTAWQARYTMPFSQGILLLAAVAMARRRVRPRWAEWVFGGPVVVLLLPGAIASFAYGLHRYTSGDSADWSMNAVRWSPPLGVIAPLLMYALGMGCLAWLILRRWWAEQRQPSGYHLLPLGPGTRSHVAGVR
jgi:Predicted membrane protein (DUF2142)